ncbi:hypothetical protein DP190_21240 [Enterobacter cloacae]|nr:hypothetical protein DP190_21240 [Enterobacter cloacae]
MTRTPYNNTVFIYKIIDRAFACKRVSVTFIPSFIFARVSYHGHFREHGHYRGQKYALQQKTLDLYCAEPAV